MDTRFNEAASRPNVFQNILQPIKDSKQENLVQAEIHSRKRQDHFKYTILLNNMRLMAIFDWWEAVQKYIFQEIENVSTSPEHQQKVVASSKKIDDVPFELKLNITDSELVVVEDTAQWDSNAVILKVLKWFLGLRSLFFFYRFLMTLLKYVFFKKLCFNVSY